MPFHTVSFDRAGVICSRSDYRELFLANNPKIGLQTNRVVADFKMGEPPLVLVSPSVSTGFDFPGDECEYQIICKVPFPVTTGKIMRARSKADKEYPMYITMQELVQMCGRGERSAEDRCEVFIVDRQMEWFISKHKALAPSWFLKKIVWVAQGCPVPAPAEKL